MTESLAIYFLTEDGFRDAQGAPNPERPDILDQLLAYWRERRRERLFPTQRDIDPIEIPHLLPHTLLVDVARDPLDFAYRLAGDYVVAHAERDLTGRSMNELAAGDNLLDRRLQRLLRRIGMAVLDSRGPVFADVRYLTVVRTTYKHLQVVCLPLSGDNATIERILVGAFYADEPQALEEAGRFASLSGELTR